MPNDTPPRPSSIPSRALLWVSPLWSLAATLRRHWLLASVLSFVSAAVAVWFSLPPGKYEVTRVLHVSAAPQNLLFEQQRGPDFHTFKQTQVALLHSRIVLTVALRSPKVADSEWVKHTPEPLEWLERNIRVSFPASSEIMHVSLSGPAEEVPILTALVDAVADAYLSEIVEKDHQRTQKRHEQLREIAGRYEKKVKAIRASMKRLREQADIGNAENLQLKQNLALREYELAAEELARTRREIRSLRALTGRAGKMKPLNEADAQRLAYLEDLEMLLVEDCKRLSREGKRSNPDALDLTDFDDELKQLDQMRVALSNRAEMLAIESEAPPRIYRLDQEAIVVAPDEQPRKLLFSAIAGVVGAGFVLGGIFLLGLRTSRGAAGAP